MRITKYLTIAFAGLMFSCNTVDKESVRPENEMINSSAKVNSTTADPFPCALTSATAIGGQDAINKLNSATYCRQPTCLNTAEILGSETIILHQPTNWTTDPFTQQQLQAFIDNANSQASALLAQNSCAVSTNNKIYNITFKVSGSGSLRKIAAEATFYCCDGNVKYED